MNVDKIIELAAGIVPIVGAAVTSIITASNNKRSNCDCDNNCNRIEEADSQDKVVFSKPENFTVNIYTGDLKNPIRYINDDISIINRNL